MTTAQHLAYEAARAAEQGASPIAVQILERAAEFAATQFHGEVVDSGWQPPARTVDQLGGPDRRLPREE